MTRFKRKSNVNNAKVIKVIVVESIVGKGTEDDVVRRITEYYSLKGELLARVDPIEEYENE